MKRGVGANMKLQNDSRLTMHDSRTITIIGAGVTGLVTAVSLQSAGYNVTVHERASNLAANRSSWLAGAMLAPHCESVMVGHDVYDFSEGAIAWWRAHTSCCHERGSIVLAHPRDAAEAQLYQRRCRKLKQITQAKLAELEPNLSEHVGSALYCAQEAHLNPRRALVELQQSIVARGGIVYFDSPCEPGGCDGIVIDARGYAARDALPGLRAVRGEMLRVHCEEVALTRSVRLLHPRFPVYIVPQGDNEYVIGATQYECDDQLGVTVRGLGDLLSALYSVHPAFAEAEVLECHAGLRPAFSNNVPQVRRVGSVIQVNGMYRHGFLASPHCAQQIVQIVQMMMEDVNGYCTQRAATEHDSAVA